MFPPPRKYSLHALASKIDAMDFAILASHMISDGKHTMFPVSVEESFSHQVIMMA